MALVKGVLDHGWWTTNPSLGFPFGQQLYDYPFGDNLNLLIVRVLGIFSHNPALVTNLFLLATFGLVALSAYAVLIRLRLSVGASMMGALLYSLLPYHFWRGESHLLLSAYYSVPLAAYLFLESLSEGREIGLRTAIKHSPRKVFSRSSLPTFLLCLVVASAGLYYAAFAVVLLLGGAVVVALVRRRIWALAPGVAYAGLIVVLLIVNLSPSLIYKAEHGSNNRIARTTADTKDLGLQLTGLVLPVRDHRVGFLKNLNQRYFDPRGTSSYCEACFETLGSVGDVGFVWLLGLALTSIVGLAGVASAFSIERRAALGVSLTLVVATVSGVSGLIALFLTSSVRGWNRMSLFIAFFSLAAAALLVDRGRSWLRRRGHPRWLAYALVAAVIALGVLDETSNYFLPDQGLTRREWRSDANFTREIESRLPRGAAVFQLPQVPYPEGYNEPAYGVNSFQSGGFDSEYELMRGYLHSSTLRWSYGAMKGRPADWASAMTTKPLRYALAAAAVDGFAGLWVDLLGYGYRDRPRVERQLTALTGQRALSSSIGDLQFFDLRPLRRRLDAEYPPPLLRTLRADSLHPLTTTCTSTGLELTNPWRHPRQATLAFNLKVSSASPKRVTMHVPGEPKQEFDVTQSGMRVVEQLNLPPGSERITFAYTGPRLVPHQLEDGPAVLAPAITDPVLAILAQPGFLAGAIPPACVQTVPAIRITNPLAS